MKARVKVEVRHDHPAPTAASAAWADKSTTVDVTIDDGRNGSGIQPTVGTVDSIAQLVKIALAGSLR